MTFNHIPSNKNTAIHDFGTTITYLTLVNKILLFNKEAITKVSNKTLIVNKQLNKMKFITMM